MVVHLRGTERLLVRLPRWLGDLVAAEPVAGRLAEVWRTAGDPARLTLAGPGRFLDLLRRCAPWAAQDPARGGPSWAAVDDGTWPRALGGQEVVLLGTGSLRSALEARRAGVPRRVGWARDGRRWLLTDAPVPAREAGGTPLGIGRPGRWPRWLPRSVTASLAELAALLGHAPDRRRPLLVADAAARAAAVAALGEAGVEPGYLLLNLGGRDGSTKAYPAWAEVLEELARRAPDRGLVAVAGPGEGGRLAELDASLAAWPGPRLVRGGETAPDLPELVALAEGCAAFATTDSGPRHVLAATGAQGVVLFGPTDPRHTVEHLAGITRLVGRAPCGPCHLEACDQAGGDRLRCWSGVEPGAVARALA